MKEAPEGSKTFFRGSKASIDVASYAAPSGREMENVFWDTEPVFPCWALFITTTCALLVAPCKSDGIAADTWERVGSSDAMYGFETFWEALDHTERGRWMRTVRIV